MNEGKLTVKRTEHRFIIVIVFFFFQLNDGPQVNLRRLQTDTIESTT